ncbi:hypothetical protein [Bradyrhizobium liaoningense]|uniref:hypothetical protein n=1 Tax=Bradyrhizobium liaoningense TaxID=43992 RepID=UPI001BA4DAD4|nr:hypothetical protein [Bradyrhizobium liaoningense]MBR0712917.1 hypothetical protein [Bradyrhizobium liaoningense]
MSDALAGHILRLDDVASSSLVLNGPEIPVEQVGVRLDLAQAVREDEIEHLDRLAGGVLPASVMLRTAASWQRTNEAPGPIAQEAQPAAAGGALPQADAVNARPAGSCWRAFRSVRWWAVQPHQIIEATANKPANASVHASD